MRVILRKLLFSILSILVGLTRLSGQEAGSSTFEIGAGLNIYGTLGATGGPYRCFSPGIYANTVMRPRNVSTSEHS